MRKLVNKNMGQLQIFFKPIFDILLMKFGDLKRGEKTAEELEKWLAWKKENLGKEGIGEYLDGGLDIADKLDEQIHNDTSFEKCEDPAAMRRAADYTDEWFVDEETKTAFRSFYVCKAGGVEWPCNTVIVSAAWDRMHADPEAYKQRWYCNVCGAKYMTKFGVMLEFVICGTSYFMQAPFPVGGWQAVKNKCIETRFVGCKTPDALLKAMPTVHPTTSDWLIKTTKWGVYSVVPGAMEDVPMMRWDQIFNVLRDDTGALPEVEIHT